MQIIARDRAPASLKANWQNYARRDVPSFFGA
jgi:hypothetical protein